MSEELISLTGDGALVRDLGHELLVSAGDSEDRFSVEWHGEAEGLIRTGSRTQRFFSHRRGNEIEVWINGEVYRISKAVPVADRDGRSPSIAGEIAASMPGMVVRVLVSDGDAVAEGDGIAVIESMKMQLTLSAPRAGVVRDLKASQGTMVEQGAVLARIEAGPQV